jgi:hypothetical protein
VQNDLKNLVLIGGKFGIENVVAECYWELIASIGISSQK